MTPGNSLLEFPFFDLISEFVTFVELTVRINLTSNLTPYVRTFPFSFPEKMLDYHILQSSALFILSNEPVEKSVKTLTVDRIIVIEGVSVGVFPLAVARKGGIGCFGAILKSPDQVRELTIVMNEVFSNCFEGT